MVVGIASRAGKVVHPCRVIIYCNSLAPGHGARSCTWDFNVELREGLMED
jgi:hypothetical protein